MTTLSVQYDSQRPAKGPYSAIVYIEGSQVITEDADGKVIAIGVAGTDDATLVQAAIDAVHVLGGGDISVKFGIYHHATKVTIKSGCRLHYEQYSMIIPTADVDLFQVKPNTDFSGVRINTADGSITYTHTCITLDGADHFSTFPGFARIHDIQLVNSTGVGKGTAILLTCPSGGAIYGSTFREIRIYGFENQIKLSQAGTGWINGNHFMSCYLGSPYYAILCTDANPPGVDGNVFDNIEIQCGGTVVVPAVVISGSSNIFKGSIWDWPDLNNAYPIVINSGAISNYIELGIGQYAQVQDNSGRYNQVVYTSKGENVGIRKVKVSTLQGDYKTLHDCLSYITPDIDNRYLIEVHGEIAETSAIVPLSYCEIIGVGDAIVTITGNLWTGLDIENSQIDLIVRNIHFKLNSSSGSYNSVAYIGALPDTCIFENCIFENISTGTHISGIQIVTTKANFRNCKFIGGSGNNSSGILFGGEDQSILESCTAIGGTTGTGCDAYQFTENSMPTLRNCVGKIGSDHNGVNYAFDVADSASPKLDNCKTVLFESQYSFVYSSANNGGFQPFTSPAWSLGGIYVHVTNARTSGAISVGTTIGGTEVVASVDVHTTGDTFFYFNKRNIVSGGYLYVSVLAGSVVSGDITIYYVASLDYADNRPIAIQQQAAPTIWGGHFRANGQSHGLVITHLLKGYLVKSSIIECINRTKNVISCSAGTITGEQIKTCTLIGTIAASVTGIDNKSSGTSTGTGSAQNIAHGLSANPIKVSVVPTVSGATVTSIWADATNIYCTVTNGKAYNWSAEM